MASAEWPDLPALGLYALAYVPMKFAFPQVRPTDDTGTRTSIVKLLEGLTFNDGTPVRVRNLSEIDAAIRSAKQ